MVGFSAGDFSDLFSDSTQGSATFFFNNSRGEIACALSLSAELTSGHIDIACGGDGEATGVSGRALTAIDSELLRSLMRPLSSSLGQDYALARIETDARFASAMAPPGQSEIIDLSVTLSGMEAPARLAILHAEETTDATIDSPSVDFAVAIVTARIASLSVPVSRLADLKPGATLMLGVPADQPVELLSGGREGVIAAEGEIGRKGNAIAVRVTRRGSYLRQASRRSKELG